jgi:DNA-binding transcriptional LysR family regulator
LATPQHYELLAYFGAVAETQSFTLAARKLGVGKGTVSRAIARLEREVGAELIHRTTHSVALSSTGAILHEQTAHLLRKLDESLESLPERAEVPSGLLRITTPVDFGHVLLPEILASFSHRYPDIVFDVRVTNAVLDLVAEGIDIAIRASAPRLKDSSLVARRLGHVSAGCYASPAYRLRNGIPRKLGDAQHKWILHPIFRSIVEFPAETKVHVVCEDLLVIRDLIRSGMGIGLLPRLVGEPYVAEGLIESVPLAALGDMEGGLFLVYPSSGQVPKKVTAFRDFVLERFEKRSPSRSVPQGKPRTGVASIESPGKRKR